MFSRIGLFAVSAILLLCQFAVSQTSFYTEIEARDPVSPWVNGDSIAGFTGSGYFFWTAGDRMSGTKEGVMPYTFTVGQSGDYVIDFRGRRNHDGICDGAANDLCNDIFVQVNDGSWEKHMIKRMGWDTWGWDHRYDKHGSGVVPHVQSLSAGQHTIRVAGRSKGVFLDALRIYKEGTTPPTAPSGGGGGGGTGDATAILEPAAGEVLLMGSTVTLKGEGTNLSWSYDANSDKLGSISIGSGSEVSFDVPTGVDSPMEITITCAGDNGTVERTYDLAAEGTGVAVPARTAIQPRNRSSVVYYGLDGRRITIPGSAGREQPRNGKGIVFTGERVLMMRR